ncbi:MAG TPA: DNA repair protein RecO C-terminal domain-containing protein, partial [Gemmatimonadaceae bacterium]|nr:DNA repair protein RecO C-terminal domain-containing protein [Gemmatimonadaceae bacterium]
FASAEAHAELYDALVATLDALAVSPQGSAADVALGGAWHLIAHLGFAPSLDLCATCHAAVPLESPASFSHPSGGVLCRRCTQLARTSRVLPASARSALRAWIGGSLAPLADAPERRAHQRLLREFLAEHLADGRPLRAYDVWERNSWGASDVASIAGIAP